MRDLEKQVSLEEISYSRMIELLNEKADKWHESKVNELNKADVIGSLQPAQEQVPCNNCQGCGCTVCGGSGFWLQ